MPLVTPVTFVVADEIVCLESDEEDASFEVIISVGQPGTFAAKTCRDGSGEEEATLSGEGQEEFSDAGVGRLTRAAGKGEEDE